MSHLVATRGGLLCLGGRRASLPRRRRGAGPLPPPPPAPPIGALVSLARPLVAAASRPGADFGRPRTGPPSRWRPPGSARAPNAAPPSAGPAATPGGREVKPSRCRRRPRSRPRGPGEGEALAGPRGGPVPCPTQKPRSLPRPPPSWPQSRRSPTSGACSAALYGTRNRAPKSWIVRWAATSGRRWGAGVGVGGRPPLGAAGAAGAGSWLS